MSGLRFVHFDIKFLQVILLLSLMTSIFNVKVIAQSYTIPDSLSAQDLMGMTLEEILNIKATSSTLTETENDLPPVPVTIISKSDIELSGARNLDELLEIYVPGFVMMIKGWTGKAVGIRGIISDRNNKILLVVNGKIMNDHTHAGATSERFMTMINDIERIEVIQSPQSTLYGPGAISGVVNIYTKDAKTEGPQNEIQVNQGLIDYYTSLQMRHSNKINDDLSYSLYYGGDYATGVSPENSPTLFTFNGNDGNGDTIIADQPASYPVNNLNSSNEHSLRHKAHAQIDYKDWSTWVRYTKGGMGFEPIQKDLLAIPSLGTNPKKQTYNYSHLTAFTTWKKKWDHWGIDARLSYDKMQLEVYQEAKSLTEPLIAFRDRAENEVYSRLIFNYHSDKLTVGVGPAVSVETFGLPAFGGGENEWKASQFIEGNNYDPNLSDSSNAYSESWTTVMLSGISEVQYLLRKNISLLGGLRVDKHTYTGLMVSPKASVVWKPKANHLVRFQYSRSNRRQDDVDLRFEHLSTGQDDGEVETIDYFELSGDVGVHKKVVIRPSLYYGDYHAVAWSPSDLVTKKLGNVNYYGGELAAIYKGNKGYGQISHNFTKISAFSGVEKPTNNISSSAYGYGSSFHNFPNHLTKLIYQHNINPKMSLSTSLQVTWYLQGAEDNAAYNSDTANNPNPNSTSWDLSDGNTSSHKTSAYLHAGYIYKFNNKLKGSFFAYNLLGLIDENLNKRVEFQRTSHYQIQPVSFALRLDYNF